MFNENKYYGKEISRFSKIGWMSILYLIIDLGLPLSVILTFMLAEMPVEFLMVKLPIAAAIWITIGILLAISDKGIRAEGYTWKVVRWSFINLALYPLVTMPSRLAGLFQTVAYILFRSRRKDVVIPERQTALEITSQ